MVEGAECGRRGDAVLKRKSLRERQAKLTPETSNTLVEMVSARENYAAFLTASVPSHVKQTVIYQRSQCQGVTRSEGEDGVPIRRVAKEMDDPLSHTRLVGDELTLGSGLGSEGGQCPLWTQQRGLPQGGRATLVGNNGDNLKSYKSFSEHVNGKSHKSGKLQLLLVEPTGDVLRKRDHWAAPGHDAGRDASPHPSRLSTCRELVHKAPSMTAPSEAACHPKAKAASSRLQSSVPRSLWSLAGIWWPTLAILLGLMLPTALGLPAVIRIGKY